ncbi:glycosyl transferase [hot springs metagenome]|uniref:Glycosyl transferase n=1 Tax=hot springs metagenome TaxID=433727 RepID=A0A5J4L306_9ZZZZ
MQGTKKIAVAIPCYNEALTIAKVVSDFRRVLPNASIYVFDNNSNDGSAMLAKEAGAIVYHVRKQGKGNVMRAIFNTISADAVIVVDGDDTYEADDALILLKPVLNNEADMVVGNRLPNATNDSLRKLHQIGNRLIVASINRMFDTNYHDILSGYRVFSRRFIDSVPLLKPGFETETEITLQALENGLEVIEIPISYRSRPAGSQSKLRSFRDGFRIMLTAFVILRDHNPMRLFGFTSLLCFFTVFIAAILRVMNYLNITELPSQILTGVMLLFLPVGTIAFGIGIILSSINSRFKEIRYLITRNRQNNNV